MEHPVVVNTSEGIKFFNSAGLNTLKEKVKFTESKEKCNEMLERL